MRILLVTGRLAEPLVRKYGKGCDVFVTPVSVAAFLTPRMIADYLERAGIRDYDMILIPGLVRGSAEEVEERIGVPTFKGPRNAVDLPAVLNAVRKGFKLSKTVPADDLFSFDALRRVEDIRNRTRNRKYIEEALKRPGNFLVGGLPVGLDFPQRILAEIVDAPRLGVEGAVERAIYYLREGADIIDVGMVAGEENVDFVEEVPEIREALRERGYKPPISVDSLNERELEVAIDVADLLLSIDYGNVETLVTEKPVVLIPTNQREGLFPEGPEERVRLLEGLKKKALDLGYKRVIADPILEHHPHLARSIATFHLYRARNPRDIMLAGVGNVTEMTDADSPGINALLAGIASELGISLLLTTEVSPKCRGSVRELKRAIDMTLLGSLKDVGLNLLILKDKRSVNLTFDPAENIVEAEKREVELEPVYFRIYIREGKIWVNAYRGTSLILTVVGNDPAAIMDTLLDNFNISPRHAFYLGRELEKAYTALRLGKDYVQEAEIFPDFYTPEL
ncbi:dihydropteroate synthase-like protein [Pyrococcus yayanosii]|uniref:Pterin-binding protein n=1 Tax=Pyrococcus yayanosii (strain CH1 / JCM 16557) TaxID=529709 RepID=F8AHJ1_PYRYC|nr:dihydropteroate synthase-like protein [Pyrococcus yayanosii]AEH25362.1 Pterin-binding protein [Pyrococcus yayanosii CH1]